MELKTIVQIMFRDKRSWQHVTEDEEEAFFFKVSRWAARKEIDNANFFNKKGMDKAIAMDLWFELFSDTLYTPSWFYPRFNPTRKKPGSVVDGADEKDMEILRMAFPNELQTHLEKALQLKTPIEVTKLKKKKGS